MIAKIIILDGKTLKNNFTIPYILEAKGNYALELAISKALEIYYGDKVRIAVEDILKVRLTAEEIQRNFTIYQEVK